jgi:hypothetical protein
MVECEVSVAGSISKQPIHRFKTGHQRSKQASTEKQVAVVTALMRISPDWDAFMKNFNRNFRPHLPVQRDLFDDIEAQEKKEAAN